MIGSRPAALRARVKRVHGMGHQNADAKKNESPCNRRAHATPPIRLDELNGRRPCTLKVIREDNAGCGLSDEIEPQRLGGNIRNGADWAKRGIAHGSPFGANRRAPFSVRCCFVPLWTSFREGDLPAETFSAVGPDPLEADVVFLLSASSAIR